MTKINCVLCGVPFITEDEERSCPNCERESMEDHDVEECPICFGVMEWETCLDCDGEGGHHDCGDDTCCCLDPEELTDVCEKCHGEGGYLQCASLPHTDEQMKRFYEESKANKDIRRQQPNDGHPGRDDQ